MSKTRAVQFIDNPAATGGQTRYVEVIIRVEPVLASWRLSLFSYEWLDPDGNLKPHADMPAHERAKRLAIEARLDGGEALTKPVLGIGLMDNIEIGSGRAEFLTLAARGVRSIPVYIPHSNVDEFKNFLDKNAQRDERGNVLFYILIAVVMLAALSLAVAQSGRGNLQQLNAEKTRLYASEVIEYSNTVATAVGQLRLRGCKETQISFANNIFAGYDNPAAPVDATCHVFAPKGGGVHWKVMPEELLGHHGTMEALRGNVIIGGNVAITDIGSGKPDLIMDILLIRKEVCLGINELLGVENVLDEPPEATMTGGLIQFTGSYDDVSPETIASNPLFDGKKAGCIRADAGGEDAYFFYRVLQAR